MRAAEISINRRGRKVRESKKIENVLTIESWMLDLRDLLISAFASLINVYDKSDNTFQS